MAASVTLSRNSEQEAVMPDPRREGGRSPKTTAGSGRDDETPEDRAVALPQGDGDPRDLDEEQPPDAANETGEKPPREAR
jgi:hypothetical protein